LALLLIGWLAVTGAGLVLATPAQADGDPASDVLATQALYLPQDAHFRPSAQQQLEAELFATAGGRTPLRVAVIASRSDLGSVTALWRRPAAYARFLDQELSLVFGGPLLVVMPNGTGVAGDPHLRPGLRAALSSAAPTTGTATDLERLTLTAIGRWLRASGQQISVGLPGRPRSGATDILAIVALALGGALIAVCWALSLRSRPLGSGLTSSVDP
jgi:hypothetical protein